ncbi:Retrovirus-related Pol polyprotein from transposon RE2 [Sesamum angolense]|uniref:Retrovirus-related Pol polyprotein from transposon RE2 n=1 Tax=Sesamum angolense TaxID=2727404 RepID=A0AAE1XFD5_9LAMI|nr:Retrovirus-related Pol polyprotein from transposon RE2 [Sesamum angolense]
MTTEGENRQNMATANTSERREPEFLQLHGGDHPGMVLVSAPFDGTDFLAWKRSVVIALRAKMKLGFIDGRLFYTQNLLGNYGWISKRDMERNNGPLVYQLRRAIASVTQGTSTVVDYFNNLIALWDELECLMPTKTCTCGLCTCGFTKITAEEDNLTKLVQFLMGLDDSFDGIRNQILVMDPFPSINKAYSMVLRVERQRMVNMQNNDNSEGVALHTKWTNNRGVNGQRNGHKGKGLIDKRSLTCSNCGKTGHSRETCFKLHGVPDWYRDLKDQKRKEGTQTRGFNVMARDGAENVTEFGEAMKQVTEFLKLMKGQLPATTTDPLQINFAQGEDFAGIGASRDSFINDFGSWIVDTGATNHMCTDSSLFTHTHTLINKSVVHLPDGSSQPVKLTGAVRLHNNLILRDVLCIPSFKYNLLSVHKLCTSNSVSVLFSSSHCWLQDQKTKTILAVGKVLAGLYIIDSSSFDSSVIECHSIPVDIPNSLHCSSIDDLVAVKTYLDDLFTIKDLGHAKYFLGLELARSSHGTYVTQHKYLQDIVHDCHLQDAKAAATPLPPGLKLDTDSGALLESPDRYRRLIGRLLYLGFSRPDISFAVQQLSQYIQHPRQPHWDAALYLVRYLKGSSRLGLFFPVGSSFQLSAYSDSDWASCVDSRRSLTGYCIFLGDSLVSWKTKKQPTVSRSSAEAEYRSMGTTVCELLWISYLLHEFSISVTSPIPFHCDNKAAIHITENPVFHERTKHLDIDCHLVRDHFKRGFILPRHVPSHQQVADMFTKSLPAVSFSRLLSKLGMIFHAPT